MLMQLGLPFLILGIFAIFWIIAPGFVAGSNLQNIGRQIAILGVVSIGQTIVLISGGLDLSVGSIVGISGVITALSSLHLGLIGGFLVGVLTGGAIGLVNGLMVARLRVPAFIATLGMLSIARGATFLITDGTPVVAVAPNLRSVDESFVGPFPLPFVIAFALFVVFQIALARMAFGRRLYATGISPTAARFSGLRIATIRVLAYVFCGLLAGLGGALLASRTGSGQPTAGQGFEFQVFTAVLLGGVSLFGGHGQLWKAMLGVLFIGLLANGMNLAGISPYIQMMAVGGVLIAALAIDQLVASSRRERWQ
jgi:ribose/xylose/arabinose/galactoside ABC-type transport system permease subunit